MPQSYSQVVAFCHPEMRIFPVRSANNTREVHFCFHICSRNKREKLRRKFSGLELIRWLRIESNQVKLRQLADNKETSVNVFSALHWIAGNHHYDVDRVNLPIFSGSERWASNHCSSSLTFSSNVVSATMMTLKTYLLNVGSLLVSVLQIFLQLKQSFFFYSRFLFSLCHEKKNWVRWAT